MPSNKCHTNAKQMTNNIPSNIPKDAKQYSKQMPNNIPNKCKTNA